MCGITVIAVGSLNHDWLVPEAKRALQQAQAIVADEAIPAQWFESLGVDRRVQWVGGDSGGEVDDGADLVSHSRGAELVLQLCRAVGSVVWVYRQTAELGSIRTAAVARGVRTLIDTGLQVRLVPGIPAHEHDWMDWFRSYPLAGIRVAVLRALHQAPSTCELLRLRGAQPIEVPAILVREVSDAAPVDRAVRSLEGYDWVVFTSTNGVEFTFARMERWGLDARAFARCGVAAVGSETANGLKERGIVADLVAPVFEAESLAHALLQKLSGKAGVRVLLARAASGRGVLVEMLRWAGVLVDDVAVYETLSGPSERLQWLGRQIGAGLVDALLLTSGSTVTYLCEAIGSNYRKVLSRTCLASIGPVTTRRAKALGLVVSVQAEPYTVEALVQGLERYFGARGVADNSVEIRNMLRRRGRAGSEGG